MGLDYGPSSSAGFNNGHFAGEMTRAKSVKLHWRTRLRRKWSDLNYGACALLEQWPRWDFDRTRKTFQCNIRISVMHVLYLESYLLNITIGAMACGCSQIYAAVWQQNTDSERSGFSDRENKESCKQMAWSPQRPDLYIMASAWDYETMAQPEYTEALRVLQSDSVFH